MASIVSLWNSTVSVLFNEPKLLKYRLLHRAPRGLRRVSVLFNEPKLLKSLASPTHPREVGNVSVLFNEPKLLKCNRLLIHAALGVSFSALQRAEIAEIRSVVPRAHPPADRFSALQRAEFAEINVSSPMPRAAGRPVSVLFNEPKLLKSMTA